MLKNTASQTISALILNTAGAIVTTDTTTVYVCGDGGTQASGGTATYEGNGVWSFTPSQANTNYDEISFLFSSSATVYVTTQISRFAQAGYVWSSLMGPVSFILIKFIHWMIFTYNYLRCIALFF